MRARLCFSCPVLWKVCTRVRLLRKGLTFKKIDFIRIVQIIHLLKKAKNQQSAPRDVLNARAGTGPEITALIRSGYQHYSLVTSEEIEKMRMDERLKVVRGLEENTMKSACRRVTSDLLQPNAVIGFFTIFF